jgi:hypothetical protein
VGGGRWRRAIKIAGITTSVADRDNMGRIMQPTDIIDVSARSVPTVGTIRPPIGAAAELLAEGEGVVATGMLTMAPLGLCST